MRETHCICLRTFYKMITRRWMTRKANVSLGVAAMAVKVLKHPRFLHSSCTSHGPPDPTWVVQRPACHSADNLLRNPEASVTWHSTLSCLTLFRSQGGKGNASVHPLLCPQHKRWLHSNATNTCALYGCWHYRCSLLWSTGRLWTVRKAFALR